MKATTYSFSKKKDLSSNVSSDDDASDKEKDNDEIKVDAEFLKLFDSLNKGDTLYSQKYDIKEGETSPPKRYTSGTLMKAMENAGQQIDDNEDLRALLKGSGIGTPATRSGILEKLCLKGYLNNNAKTQVITPKLLGEMIYDVVDNSIRPLLDPRLTASWEKGLNQVAEGTTSYAEYREKLYDYVARRTELVRGLNNQNALYAKYNEASKYYKSTKKSTSKNSNKKTG